jgi:hypothetical protein
VAEVSNISRRDVCFCRKLDFMFLVLSFDGIELLIATPV